MSSPSSDTAAGPSVVAASLPASILFKKKRSRPSPTQDLVATSSPSSSLSHQKRPFTTRLGRKGADEDEEDGDEERDQYSAGSSRPTVVHKSRKIHQTNLTVQSSGFSLAKRNRLAAAAAGEDDEADLHDREDEYTSVSARAKATTKGASTLLGDDATRSIDWFDQGPTSSSASAFGSTAPAPVTEKATNDDGVYRGLSSYSSALPQSNHKNKYAARGPIRAPTNIRTVTVVDYQPDVCKDYKETGYCGFGDTCKFLHDRSDYLAGWQMEAAYLPNSTSRRDLFSGGGNADDDEDGGDAEEEEIPFACLICRKPFEDPIQTRCGHYFCSSCAIKRFSKTPKCFACGAQTGGIFNSARKVIERMEKRRRDREERREELRSSWTGGHQIGEVEGEEDNAGYLSGIQFSSDQQQEDDDV